MLLPDLVNTIANRLNIDPQNIRGGLTYHLLFNYLDKLKNEVNLSAYVPAHLFDQHSSYFEFPLDENRSLLMISFLRNTGYLFFLKQRDANVEFISYHFFSEKLDDYVFTPPSNDAHLLNYAPLKVANYWCFFGGFSQYVSSQKDFVEFAKLVFYALNDSYQKDKKYFFLLSWFRTASSRKELKRLLKDIFAGNNLTRCEEYKNIIFSVRHIENENDNFIEGHRKNFFTGSKDKNEYNKQYIKHPVFHGKAYEQHTCITEFIDNSELDILSKLDLLDVSIGYINVNDCSLFRVGDYLFLRNYLFYYPKYSKLETKSFAGFAKSYINNYQKYLLTEYCKRDNFESVINDYFSSKNMFSDGFYKVAMLPYFHSIESLDAILTLPDFCFDYYFFDKNNKDNIGYEGYKNRVAETIWAENIEYRNALSEFAIKVREKANNLIITDDIMVI